MNVLAMPAPVRVRDRATQAAPQHTTSKPKKPRPVLQHYREVERPEPQYARKIEDAADAMNTLRDEMFNYSLKDLSEATGLSRACISAIKSGRTRWPRPDTFFTLVRFFDLKLMLIKN